MSGVKLVPARKPAWARRRWLTSRRPPRMMFRLTTPDPTPEPIAATIARVSGGDW